MLYFFDLKPSGEIKFEQNIFCIEDLLFSTNYNEENPARINKIPLFYSINESDLKGSIEKCVEYYSSKIHK